MLLSCANGDLWGTFAGFINDDVERNVDNDIVSSAVALLVAVRACCSLYKLLCSGLLLRSFLGSLLGGFFFNCSFLSGLLVGLLVGLGAKKPQRFTSAY